VSARIGRTVERVITCLIVFGPLLAVVLAVVHFWAHGVSAHDLVLAVVLYFVAGHGVTIGFHRLFGRHPVFVRVVQDLLYPLQGNDQPIGTIIHFIIQFVDGFFQKKSGHQRL